MRTTSLWVALALALGCGAGAVPSGSTTPPPDDEAEAPPVAVAVALRIEPDDGDEPRARIELVRIHDEGEVETEVVSELDGICQPARRPGTVAAVRCWWSGEDTWITATRDADRLLVHGQVGEGEAMILREVDLPRGALLRGIGP